MTRRRWIADEVSGHRAALVGEHADHLVKVLRARVGQEFDISTGVVTRRGKITSLSAGRVEFELAEDLSNEPLAEITVILAIFKFDRMEWAIEKCTELGVTRIVPLIAKRTDSHLAAASVKRLERWRRIVRQAAEQSRRSAVPEIVAPIKLSEIRTIKAGLRIVLAESEQEVLMNDILRSNMAGLKDDGGVILAVGPEGGWTEEELLFFQQEEWIAASLGNTILRAETAAIAATAVVASALHSL